VKEAHLNYGPTFGGFKFHPNARLYTSLGNSLIIAALNLHYSTAVSRTHRSNRFAAGMYDILSSVLHPRAQILISKGATAFICQVG
jgi:hypothetical protein